MRALDALAHFLLSLFQLLLTPSPLLLGLALLLAKLVVGELALLLLELTLGPVDLTSHRRPLSVEVRLFPLQIALENRSPTAERASGLEGDAARPDDERDR